MLPVAFRVMPFFDYQLFSGNNNYLFPDYFRNRNSRLADMRNLLYWQPHIELSNEESTKISFYTSDAKGQYAVTIRGLNENGVLVVFNQKVIKVE